jgi:hypothetical protein
MTGGAGWGGARCEEMKTRHVGVFVKGWTWIPDALDGVYTCRCGVTCVWSKAAAVVDRPDAMLFEGATPPQEVLLHFVPSDTISMQCKMRILLTNTQSVPFYTFWQVN